MTGAVRGWCPGAWTPMMSGDGLVVRVRPPGGRLTAAQVRGLADLSVRAGSGVLDLTRRANLQIRGVAPDAHDALLAGLDALGLLDPTPRDEARRNLLVQPFWRPGDLTDRLARALAAVLPRLPDLPAKFGLALDTGAAPVLRDAPADIRIERGPQGPIVAADGAATGIPVPEAELGAAVLDLAGWFAAHRGEHRRMAARAASGLPARFGGAPRPAAAMRPGPGTGPLGALAGMAFGQVAAPDLAAALGDAPAVRLTPWRLILIEGAAAVPAGWIADPGDPLLTADACPGAPACARASVATREVARRLAGRVGGALHVSGCAKGCARSAGAAVTLVGRDGRFDLVRDGRAGDTAQRHGLGPDDLDTITG